MFKITQDIVTEPLNHPSANRLASEPEQVKDDLHSKLRSFSTPMFASLNWWNANQCGSLQMAYLKFEIFQIPFLIVSVIFIATKLLRQVISERTKA